MTLIEVFIVLISFIIVAFVLDKYRSKKLSKEIEKVAKQVLEEAATVENVGNELNYIKEAFVKLGKDIAIRSEAESKSLIALTKAVKETPSKTLSTIQGSVNNTVGKMGEMMQLIELQRIYDRLIVAGDIVDYIGIRFPIGDIPGAIDFIDIKTGKSASLSSDQRKLRDLIEKSADIFTFKVVKVQIT